MTQVVLQHPGLLHFDQPSLHAFGADIEMEQTASFSFPATSAALKQEESVEQNPLHLSVHNSSLEPRRTHRRARTSINAKAPLPEFKFGSSSAPTDPEPATPPDSYCLPDDTPIMPTGMSRHRRVVTELVTPNNASPSEPTSFTFPQTSSASLQPSRAKHGHRRSGAISTSEIRAITADRIPSANPSVPSLPSNPAVGANSEQVSPTEPHRRTVEFSNKVETIPRPQSLVSSGSGSSSSTVRDSTSPGSRVDSPFQFPLSASPLQDPLATFDLDENFDDDPTMTLTIPAEEAQDRQQAIGVRPIAIPPPHINTSVRPPLDSSGDMIDLDSANADTNLTPNRSPVLRSSFQKARILMHSSGGGIAHSGIAPLHRRSESTPTLPPPRIPFHRLNSSASDRGFEISNVIEDDEGEEEDCEQDPRRIILPAQLPTVKGGIFTNYQPAAARSTPTLLPPIQFYSAKGADGEYDSSDDQVDRNLEKPRPPFVSDEVPSSSSGSSPQYLPSGPSSCEPSPGCFQSADDVPSLISTSSTVSSSVHPTIRSDSVPSVTLQIAGSMSSLNASEQQKHQKRLSIASISRLINFQKTPNGSVASLPIRRSSNLPSQNPKAEMTRTERVSKMRKFWNSLRKAA